MYNKRGWLLSVFALVLILLIFGTFVMLRNQKDTVSFHQDLPQQASIVGYGVYNQQEQDLSFIVAALRKRYDRGKLYVIVCDSNELRILSYDEINQGSVQVLTGTGASNVPVGNEEERSGSLATGQQKVSVEIDQKVYKFKLKPNEKSYFVVYENE